MPEDDLPEYLDEIHQDIAEFYGRHADFLDEDFVDRMLESRNYQKESRWALPADSGQQGQGGQRKRPGVRPPQGQGAGQRRSPYFKGSQR